MALFCGAGNGEKRKKKRKRKGREKAKEKKTQNQKKRDSKGLGNIKNRVALLNELHNCKIHMKVTDAGLSPDVGTMVRVSFRN